MVRSKAVLFISVAFALLRGVHDMLVAGCA